MKTEQEMIDKIYEVVADKELSFGCKIVWRNGNHHIRGKVLYDNGDELRVISGNTVSIILSEHLIRAIGHNVMIGDVLEECGDKSYIPYHDCGVVSYVGYSTDILKLWKKKRKPIESQSKECKEFVYNLIKGIGIRNY